MKSGDFYRHWKDKEYYFCGIALPIGETMYEREEDGSPRSLESNQVALDAHTPKEQEPKEIKLYNVKGITLIDSEYPHVIYQAEEDYETDKVWARRVDDFFDYVEDHGELEKRFELINK